MIFDWPQVNFDANNNNYAELIPVSQPSLSELEEKYVLEAIKSTNISGSGFFVEKAEKLLEQRLRARTLTVSNGSVAIILALNSLGISKGDEVLVPALTYAASASSVVHVGATPVFCDVEPDSWNISLPSMERMLTPRTKAIIVVHLYGVPANMDILMNFATKNNLKVIEDAAESFGALYKQKQTGTIGDAGTYSFFANKILTSGEGGAVTFKSPVDFQKAKILKGQGMDPQQRYYFILPGYNFRLNNISASILCAQLERSIELIIQRNHIFSSYDTYLYNRVIRQSPPDDSVSSPWLYTFTLPGIEVKSRLRLAQYLASKGIETRPIFYPLNIMPAFQEFPSDNTEISSNLAKNSMSLPTYFDLSDEKIQYICEKLIEGMESCL
jgi:perosamine synthetase